MTTVVRSLERLADWLLIGLFLLIFALVLAQIFFRYVLDDPLVWSEELARLAFVWVAMLAWSLGSRRRSHITITYFAGLLPRAPRLLLAIAAQGLIVLLCSLLVWHGWGLTLRNLDMQLITVGLPYAVVYVVVPLGAAIVMLYALAEIRDRVVELRSGAPAGPSGSMP
jgi:TRAP-type C4-dicarboxylate transport system permease small subunit